MLPILANYSTVIALIRKIQNPTVRKCLDCLSGDVMMKSVQKGNSISFFLCNAEFFSTYEKAFRRPKSNIKKNINEVKQIYM
jgi:hypothetical protein